MIRDMERLPVKVIRSKRKTIAMELKADSMKKTLCGRICEQKVRKNDSFHETLQTFFGMFDNVIVE